MSGTLTFSVHAGSKGDTPDVREFPPEVSWNSQLSSRGAGGDRARSTRSQDRQIDIDFIFNGSPPRRAAQINTAPLPRAPAVKQTMSVSAYFSSLARLIQRAGEAETERVVTLLELFCANVTQSANHINNKKKKLISYRLLKNGALLALAAKLLSHNANWSLLPVLANVFSL